MIIACPHCQTKYQVTYEAIGSADRKVQCAHCQQAWQQAPVGQDDTLAENQAMLDAIVEDGLGNALQAEEQAVAAGLARHLADQENHQNSASAAKIDPAAVRSHLLDGAGESIYAWSIAPAIADLMAGERATFDTRLAIPPGDVRRVRLTFDEADGAQPNSRVRPVAIEAVNATSADITTPPEHH